MVTDQPLPFKEGSLVETKSFLTGYRGAWFRCKITKISWKKDRIGCVLHYIDFPDEKEKWTESYQVPRYKKGHERVRQLMLRPTYPHICCNDQLPSSNPSSEAVVVTEGSWRVGDLVDWLKDGCYWSGKVTQILGNEEAMVELMPVPIGEGNSYKVSVCDLRPSLDWSPEDGWTVPTPEDVENFQHSVQIVFPVTQIVGSQSTSEVPTKYEGVIDHSTAVELPHDLTPDSHVQVRSPGDNEMIIESQSPRKEEISTTGTSTKTPGDNGSDSVKKLKACVEVPLISDKVDTLEAAIMDLEELANKFTWLEEFIKYETPMSNMAKPSWKFVEHKGSSVPK